MKWELSNGTITKNFRTLIEAGEFLGYTPQYLSQKYRMDQELEGYKIRKIKQPSYEPNKYSLAMLRRRVERLEEMVANLQGQIDELDYIKREI